MTNRCKLRVFGPDHEWQIVTLRAEVPEITKVIREEVAKGTDITITLEPWGEGDPFTFPYPVPPTLDPEQREALDLAIEDYVATCETGTQSAQMAAKAHIWAFIDGMG